MMTSAWPYILRLALSTYFLFNHLPTLLNGFKSVTLNKSIFACTGDFIPPLVAFNLWHGAFVLLAALILLWPKPITYLALSLLILLVELYINFSMQNYDATSLLIIISILINIALLIIFSRGRRY